MKIRTVTGMITVVLGINIETVAGVIDSRSNDEPRVGTRNVCRHCIPRGPPQGQSRDGRPEGEGVGALRMNVRTDTHRAFQDNRYPESSSDSDSDTSSSSSSASSSSASSRDYGIRSRNEYRYGRRS